MPARPKTEDALGATINVNNLLVKLIHREALRRKAQFEALFTRFPAGLRPLRC